MQQQDSQELLRYLMDGLRNEEAKRQKQAILKYFGLTEKTDPKVVKDLVILNILRIIIIIKNKTYHKTYL